MLNAQEFHVQKEILEMGGLPAIGQSIELIQEYVKADHGYESKNDRLACWSPDKGEIYELIISAFTICLANHTLTYQSISSMLAPRVGLDNKIARVKTAAEVIALISRTGMIDIQRSGSGHYIMVSTRYELDSPLPEAEDRRILIEEPELQEGSNRYHDDNSSLILGGRINHHDEDICLDHINRMNSIELKLYKPFIRKYEEKPTFVLDNPKKKQQWEKFLKDSYEAYLWLSRKGNRFHLKHYYDNRSRCYAHGYHITTQGSSFKKAIVQLANTELVEG